MSVHPEDAMAYADQLHRDIYELHRDIYELTIAVENVRAAIVEAAEKIASALQTDNADA